MLSAHMGMAKTPIRQIKADQGTPAEQDRRATAGPNPTRLPRSPPSRGRAREAREGGERGRRAREASEGGERGRRERKESEGGERGRREREARERGEGARREREASKRGERGRREREAQHLRLSALA